jgi:integrase
MPAKVATTHVLMGNELVLYQREHSTIWQCRYKVDDVWQRATTKQRDIKKAKAKARELMIEAEIRKRSNLPFITRKFRHVAKLAIDRMQTETAAGKGKVSFKDYIRVINDYLIPFFGNYSITSVDYTVLDEFNTWRTERMEKAPAKSTLLTQNSALNRVFDEAVVRGFLTAANRPKLESKGKASDRRPAFSLQETRALLGNFDAWIERAGTEQRKELRHLLRDYVVVLLETGARPGDELLNLRWRQVRFEMKPIETKTGVFEEQDESDEQASEIVLTNLNRSCWLEVTGKTGTRTIAGMNETIKALVRIIKRNYGTTNPHVDPLRGIAVATNNDFVFRTKAKDKPTSFQKRFEDYLEEHNLLIDPITEKKRVFYSLRHTYATLAITYDWVPFAALTLQMGTSVGMIQKHYNHLNIKQAIEQLRMSETKKLLGSGGVIDEIYRSTAYASKNAAVT